MPGELFFSLASTGRTKLLTVSFFFTIPAFRELHGLTETAMYRRLPDDWHVVAADVRGSTVAIEGGRYKDVNAVGAACIVAVLNATRDLDVPFMFGGDGATLAVPADRVDRLAAPLRAVTQLAKESFDLSLRTGIVDAAHLRRLGHELLVARYAPSEHVSLAMFGGTGWAAAENLIKSNEADWAVPEVSSEAIANVDFEGFECRWQPIETRNGQMVSLLVKTRGDFAQQGPRFMRELDAVVGGLRSRSPVHASNLRLATSLSEFEAEARVRSRARSGFAFLTARLRARLQAAVGAQLMARRLKVGGFDGGQYFDQVIDQTDFFKYDGVLRAVLDLDPTTESELMNLLDAEEAAGRIDYGVSRSEGALMTCMVFDRAGNHVHFVDGSDGGYALAAKQLKTKL